MRPRGWRVTALLREAWLGVTSHVVRSVVMVALVAVVCGGLAMLELRDARSALDFHRDFIEAGGTVVVVEATDGQGIDAARCDGLERRPAVVSAGAIGEAELASFERAPGLLLQRAPVTRGALETWDPGAHVPSGEFAGGLATGDALAEELGLAPGMAVAFEGGEARELVTTVDPERRHPQVARWALEVVAPAGAMEQCWVEFTPGAYDAGLASAGAVFATRADPPAARPYRGEDEFRRDAAADFRGRPQGTGWVLGALLIGAVGWLMTWFRRPEIGLYLALGTRRMSLLFLSAVEAWLLIGAGLLLGVAYAVAIEVGLGHTPGWAEPGIALRTAVMAALLATVAAPLGHLLVRGNVLGLLKDR